MTRKRHKRMEFSKKIFIVIASLFIIIIAYSMALMWATMDTSPLAYLIPSVGGLMATCVGFYYNKSKAENILRMSQSQRDIITNTVNSISNFNSSVQDYMSDEFQGGDSL